MHHTSLLCMLSFARKATTWLTSTYHSQVDLDIIFYVCFPDVSRLVCWVYFLPHSSCIGVSQVAQQVKNPPATQEMWVLSLGWEAPLEEDMATYASILAGKIPWIEEPGGLWSMGSQKIGHDGNDWAHTHTHTHSTYIIACMTAYFSAYSRCLIIS